MVAGINRCDWRLSAQGWSRFSRFFKPSPWYCHRLPPELQIPGIHKEPLCMSKFISTSINQIVACSMPQHGHEQGLGNKHNSPARSTMPLLYHWLFAKTGDSRFCHKMYSKTENISLPPPCSSPRVLPCLLSQLRSRADEISLCPK